MWLSPVQIFPTEKEAGELKKQRAALGSTMGNMESWLLLRSLRTLGLRVSQQSQTATELAEWLHAAAASSADFDGIPAGAVVQVMHASVQMTSFDKRKQMPGGYGAVFAVLVGR
ncbi:MAG: hypothetical protein BJ554DRAFT_3729 [Olpidium bornovanus]|uniref:Uncharacterized protein n=1 Tax=Olpidium bornovanus TaxID=278681 RepID=A0A8H7ZNC1_9FUNG|nr:MAG: hypothetical protein BJ554DRAFT_3729 [Olpidium bornovanus]